jgi:DNA topoisomerase-1
MSVPEKLLAYNRANRAVAILCNHQRAVPKTHNKAMENLQAKIQAKREQIQDLEQELKVRFESFLIGTFSKFCLFLQDLKRDKSAKGNIEREKKRKQLERTQEQLKKLEIQETDKDENKTIALGTSKLNYLDPRISVAW